MDLYYGLYLILMYGFALHIFISFAFVLICLVSFSGHLLVSLAVPLDINILLSYLVAAIFEKRSDTGNREEKKMQILTIGSSTNGCIMDSFLQRDSTDRVRFQLHYTAPLGLC